MKNQTVQALKRAAARSIPNREWRNPSAASDCMERENGVDIRHFQNGMAGEFPSVGAPCAPSWFTEMRRGQIFVEPTVKLSAGSLTPAGQISSKDMSITFV